MKIYTVSLADKKAPIKEWEATESEWTPGMMVVKEPPPFLDQYFHREGKGWFRTRADAVKAADRKRLVKITSLRKQIERLEKLEIA